MKENENPSAFPHVVYNQNGGHWEGRYEIYKQDGGMTLRDYFAAHATEDDVAKWVDILLCNGISSTREQAKFAYADAMLAARKEAAMNTPSNAGKEHNPWDRKPHEYGAPEWRLLNTDEAVQIGDECNYKDYRCEPRWVAVEHAGYLPISHTEYRRRTTPPTQSQEGETPECDAIGIDHIKATETEYKLRNLARKLERRLTAAQRENDRLRAHVKRLIEEAKNYAANCPADQDTTANFYAAGVNLQTAIHEAEYDAARAATEEGK